jgi:hypothetical protein
MRDTTILCLIMALLLLADSAAARPREWVLRDGKFHVKGQWVFLKIAKPLRDFADERQVDQLIADLELLQAKHYNAIEINCYWHHFDDDGDGVPDRPTEPLRRLVDAIYERGMYPCLSVETYGVGGGQIPRGFWKKHADAIAVDSRGQRVKDEEYGFGSAVPSLFSPAYLAASRSFIRNITKSIDHNKILHFETTVEPQYMGLYALDFSTHARREFEQWLTANNLAGPGWPASFPVPDTFLEDPTWNRFRAEWLAAWVNGDADAFRGVAGDDIYIAVDYLETCGPDMRNRNGDSLTFLRYLTSANIIQVNWHWHVAQRAPNQCAYDNVRRIMKETGRDWAITEHMTFNGSDYAPHFAEDMLRNTLRQGTQFGWEFTNVAPSDEPFSLYNPDWSPKPLIKIVDDRWDLWIQEIRAAAEE